MKMLLWKECRENLKWAVLAMIALALAELYGLTKRDQFYVDESSPLCKNSFLIATTFGCAAVGAVLGLVQILPEQRRDQWAALIHRPVERATIYRGKAISGFCLYVLAVIPPFLVSIWYAAAPGHFPWPFVPGTILPGVADICAGAMYYFGALFVALRRGPWYGVRTLGLLAPLYASAFITSNYQPFFVSIEAAVLMAVAPLAAGWSAMQTNGTMRGQPWIGRVALLAVAFYGVAALSRFGGMLEQSFVRPEYYYGSEYVVDLTGRVLKQVQARDQAPKFYDLAGNLVTDKQFSRNYYTHLVFMAGVSSHIGDAHRAGNDRIIRGTYRESRSYLVQSNESTGEVWYYIFSQKIFVGYKAQSYARIGSIGANGFRPGYESVTPLSGPYSGAVYQVENYGQVGDTVCHLDFDEREFTPVFSAPGEKVYGSAGMMSYQQNQDLSDVVAVALLHEIRMVDKTGATLAELPYHQDVDQYGTLQVGMLTDRAHFFLRYNPSDWIPWEKRLQMPSYLEEMDAKGAVLASYTFPPQPIIQNPKTWWQWFTSRLGSPVYAYGGMAYTDVGAALGVKHLQRSVKPLFSKNAHGYRVYLLQTTLFSAAFAAIAFFWARRNWFSPRRAWLWALFVFGFNITGLIVFRLCADWPVAVNCPKCGRKRPVEKETCPACGAGWPEPAREGTEIFTPVETAVASPV